MKRKALGILGLFTLLWLISGYSWGQSGINNLIFNSTEQIIGLNFSNSASPTLFYTGKRASATIGEGIAHAENQQGEIVFWVNSSGVYDRNNTLMPGANGILAHPSSTEIVISPFPDQPSKYYIFYNNQLCSTLYYSVVNMQLRGGAGDVERLNVAISPDKNFAEGLEVVRIPCTKNYWLIANECGKGLTRFKVSETGLSAGEFFLSNPHNTGGRGELDYHKGKLGYAITYHSSCLLTDFDPVSGTVSNSRFIPLPLQNGAYGLEFSPDASKLYVSDLSNRDIFGNLSGNNLYAIDLASGAGRGWSILNTNASCTGLMEGLGHIEQGKDGKLYISQIGGCQVVVVDNANSSDPVITKIDVGTVLSAGISDHIQSDFLNEDLLQQAAIEVQGEAYLCGTEPVLLAAQVDAPADKQYQWYLNNVMIQGATARTYAAVQAGVYTVKISNTYGCSLQTAPVSIEDNRLPAINFQRLYESCGSAPVILNYPAEGYQVTWFDGTTGFTKEVSNSGEYAVTVSKGECARTELIKVDIRPKVQYMIPNVITPNGDGRNDFFVVNDLQEPVHLYLYNRWGALVYSSLEYQNNWQGSGLPDGTYFYRFIPLKQCGQEQKGWLQLLRGAMP